MPAASKPPPEEAEEVDEILAMFLEVPKPSPPTNEQPPPYDSAAFPSLHAQSSRLLAGWEPSQKPPEERFLSATNNRNPRVTNAGFRRCTRHLTARNLLIALVVLLALLGSFALLLYFLGVLQISETVFSVRFVTPSTTTAASTILSTVPTTSTVASTTSTRVPKRATIPLILERRVLGTFKGEYRRMTYDWRSGGAILLSDYSSEERQLKSAKLIVSKHREGFTYTSNRTPAGYDWCKREWVKFFCCTVERKTDCFDVASNMSTPRLQPRNDLPSATLFYTGQHTVFDYKLGKMVQMEDNGLPPSSVSVDISLYTPYLNELVRTQDDFYTCKYKRVFYSDYVYELQKPGCRTMSFNVDHTLPTIDSCTQSTFTAVVQSGHRAGEEELTFLLQILFDGKNKAYSSQESVRTPYNQLRIYCEDDKLDIYVLGETQIVAFGFVVSDIRHE